MTDELQDTFAGLNSPFPSSSQNYQQNLDGLNNYNQLSGAQNTYAFDIEEFKVNMRAVLG